MNKFMEFTVRNFIIFDKKTLKLYFIMPQKFLKKIFPLHFFYFRSAEYSLPVKKDLENVRIELNTANEKLKVLTSTSDSTMDEFNRHKRYQAVINDKPHPLLNI